MSSFLTFNDSLKEQDDLGSRHLASLIESTSVAGQPGQVVIGPDGGAVPVSISGSSVALTPTSGQVNVAAGPAQTALGSGQKDVVQVIAKITNLSSIALGPTGVTTANGLLLEPGRGIVIENVNLSAVFINGTAGEGVSWFATS